MPCRRVGAALGGDGKSPYDFSASQYGYWSSSPRTLVRPWIHAGSSLYCQEVSLSEPEAPMPTRDDARGWSAQRC
jgi:hypothetical protein